MELEVHLRREGDEPWGFRLIGGVDFIMPLTVVKVKPNSPAEKAGLRNGDIVSSINGEDASTMEHEDSRRSVAAAVDILTLSVVRGLYDPVLDDYEPIYEPIDQEDSDQPSQPTEVPDPNADICPELNDLLQHVHFNGIDPASLGPDNLDTSFSRSLTASPYVGQAKPFRPFSTEPQEVPPLENPIILNPDYHDVFKKFGIDDDFMPKTRFKLPISEQYDPDGTKQKMKTPKEVYESAETELESHVKEVTEIVTKQEVSFMEETKKESDLEKIEKTATSIVEESLEKAVLVAEEIKREIDVELHEVSVKSSEVVESSQIYGVSASRTDIVDSKSLIETTVDRSEDKTVIEAKQESISVESKEAAKEVTELVNLIDKTTEEIIKQNGSIVEATDIKQEAVEKQKIIVKQKDIFEKDDAEKIVSVTQKDTEKKDTYVKKVTEEAKLDEVKMQESSFKAKDVEQKVKIDTKTEDSKTSDRRSTSTLLAEQRAYTIGLQTIPNIRGTLHSSCHYNLLLKTFFIHLTDVMVALSRFILSEPVLDREVKQEMTQRETKNVVTESVVSKDEATEIVTKSEKNAKREMIDEVAEVKNIIKEDKIDKKERVDAVTEQKVQQFERKETAQVTQEKQYANEKVQDSYEKLDVEELEERRKLSGSRMAQLVEKKSEDLTHKMDAVITEFQTKAGIEETTVVNDRAKSLSRQEETIQENAPALGLLSKVDYRENEERTKTEVSEMITASTETLRTEARKSKERSKSRERNTYIAIVEAHVYTNKDAILDEQLVDFSETSSVVSADEVNIALVANEALSTEKVALENVEMKTEVAKSVVEKQQLIAAKKDEKIDEVKEQEVVMPKKMEIVKFVEKPKIVAAKKEKVIEQNAEVKKVQLVEKAEIKAIVNQDLVQKKMFQPEVKPKEKQEVVQKKLFQPEVKPKEKQEVVQKKLFQPEVKPKEKQEVVQTKLFQPDVKTKEKQEVVQKKLFQPEIKPKEKQDVVQKKLFQPEVKPKEKKEVIQKKMFQPEVKPKEKQEIIQKKLFQPIVKKEKVQTLQTAYKQSAATIQTVAITEVNEIKSAIKDQVSIISKEKSVIDETSQAHTEAIEQKEETVTLKLATEEVSKSAEITETHKAVNKTEMRETKHAFETKTEQYETKNNQQSTFVAKRVEQDEQQKLALNTDLPKQISDENNNTPTPTSTVPPTPLTEEYIFKLEIPLPKRSGTPIPRDCTPTPEDEDPNIVKKKFLPFIDTQIEDEIKYDPPLKSPPTSPKYTKPGLRGGADKPQYSKEEILEIERKSSLLASAIDQTIKSIEEYKEEVGINEQNPTNDSNVEITEATSKHISGNTTANESNGVVYNGYAKIVETKFYDTNFDTTMDDLKDTTIPIVEMNGIIMDTKQDTEVVVATVNDTEVLETAVKTNGAVEMENKVMKDNAIEDKKDAMEGYRPVNFNPEELQQVIQEHRQARMVGVPMLSRSQERELYKSASGELLGTVHGIVDGLEEAVVEPDSAKELGKPGITEEKIAELISGESEMLREAHVMGLSRVLASHMHRPDDSSVDFKRIKPLVESLKDSEVLKAINEEILKKAKEEKKKEERKWTTFLQKPKRPVPKAKFGYYGYVEPEEKEIEEPYKVKIVKQPKPKVAPDYKPEDFNTGLLPWEERALREPTPPPVEAEEPILIPEEFPEILEAVDPLPESEVPDLEDSGIPLPPPKPKDPTPTPEEEGIEEEDLDLEAIVEETEKIVEEKLVEEMDQTNLAEQLLMSVQNMVDPSAPLDQQLAQMRAQLAALAQLPCVIQQSLELVTKQLGQLSQLEAQQQVMSHTEPEAITEVQQEQQVTEVIESNVETRKEEESQEITVEEEKPELTPEELERMKKEEEAMIEEQQRMEKMKKEQMLKMEQERLGHESRQVKQRPTPRVGKPKPVFGPMSAEPRPLVLPGGRKWRGPKDAYNEQFYTETLAAQAEIIQGKTKGINFMKWEKPPVSLDHLQNSEVFKLVHNMDQSPLRRVDMLTPVVAEADYREKCRSITPCTERMAREEHLDIPQQVQP